MDNSPHLFCFGLGYSAVHLAKQLLEKGWQVSGTCRTQDKCDQLRPLGISAYVFDDELPLFMPELVQQAQYILHSIPPGENGDSVYNMHGDILTNHPDLKWFGYLSTTGVYGDHGGEWVDETTPTNPPNERSLRRAEAETLWLLSGIPAHIFRLAGIYGPGRSSIDALKAGTARRIDKPGQVFSRIHVDDIAQILSASMQHPNPGAIYNCADDSPAPQSEVVAYAASLLNMDPPPLIPFEEADLSPMARSFYGSNRRVKNLRIKDELGVQLHFPSYHEGIQALAKGRLTIASF